MGPILAALVSFLVNAATATVEAAAKTVRPGRVSSRMSDENRLQSCEDSLRPTTVPA
jgi:hypothetical protein